VIRFGLLETGSLAGLLALAGCGVQFTEVGSPCANPAPLEGRRNSAAPGYIVVFKDGTDAAAATEQLARKHGFVPSYVYTRALAGFAAQFPDSTLAALRCEPVVKYISHDDVTGTGTAS
jgi:hypothetical protein